MASSTGPRAIGYLRVSTGLQAEHGMGLELQNETVCAYAEAAGYALVDVVREAASGGVQNGELFSWEHRPALLKLLERAKGGEYEVLVVAKFDRLSRDHATLTIIERMLQQHGVAVVSAAENNGDEPTARLMRTTLAGFAEYERELIRERMGAGKAAAKRAGRHIHGQIPYGFQSTGHGRLKPVDELVPIVRRIFEDARDGYSPGRIAAGLNADGVASPRGCRWSKQGIARMLQNPAYVGERHEVKRAHPSIVSRKLWNETRSGTHRT